MIEKRKGAYRKEIGLTSKFGYKNSCLLWYDEITKMEGAKQMKLIRKNKHCTTFKELKIGDVFEIYGDVYLKINFTDAETNALNLKENFLTSFGTNEEVVKLKAELTVW